MAKSATAEVEESQAVEADDAEAPETDKPKPASVTLARFGLEAEFNTVWRVNVSMDVKPEDCLDEMFWAHLSNHLRPCDTIRVIPDNMSWELLLHVAGKGRGWAHVIEKERYDLRTTKVEIQLPPIYKVEFAGSHHKWRVLREGNMLRDGFETEGLARRYAANHESAVDR